MQLNELKIGSEFRLVGRIGVYKLKQIVDMEKYKFAVAINSDGEDCYFHDDVPIYAIYRVKNLDNNTSFVHNSRWYKVQQLKEIRCVDASTGSVVWLKPDTEVIV